MSRAATRWWLMGLCLAGAQVAAQPGDTTVPVAGDRVPMVCAPSGGCYQDPSRSLTLDVMPVPQFPRPGWPLVLEVRVRHRALDGGYPKDLPPDVKDLVLAPGWHEHLTLEVRQHAKDPRTGRRRNKVEWPFRRVTATSERLVLGRGTAPGKGVVRYVLTSEQTAGLAPGLYFISASLEFPGPASEKPWQGYASGSMYVDVQAPQPPSPGLACEELLAQVKYHSALGETKHATQLLDSHLATNAATAPELCWGARGTLAEQQGNPQGAVEYYRQGSRAYWRDVRDIPYETTGLASEVARRRPSFQVHCVKLLEKLAGREVSDEEVEARLYEEGFLLDSKPVKRPRLDRCE